MAAAVKEEHHHLGGRRAGRINAKGVGADGHVVAFGKAGVPRQGVPLPAAAVGRRTGRAAVAVIVVQLGLQVSKLKGAPRP